MTIYKSTSYWCTIGDKNWTARPWRNFTTSSFSQSPKFPLSLSLMWWTSWIWHPWLLGLQYNPQRLKWPYLTNWGFKLLDILNLQPLQFISITCMCNGGGVNKLLYLHNLWAKRGLVAPKPIWFWHTYYEECILM